jgi:hypothetical protein
MPRNPTEEEARKLEEQARKVMQVKIAKTLVKILPKAIEADQLKYIGFQINKDNTEIEILLKTECILEHFNIKL